MPNWFDEDVIEPRFFGPPRPVPADWLTAEGPVSNPLGFLLRPWAPPQEVCARASADLAVAEQGDSGGADEVFCYWLTAPSPSSSIFFQATGSPTDTWYVRFKLTGTTETLPADASGFSAILADFHARLGWTIPTALPDPARVEDASFETRGIQYRLWREDGDIPRINLTMVFPQTGLGSTAFSR